MMYSEYSENEKYSEMKNEERKSNSNINENEASVMEIECKTVSKSKGEHHFLRSLTDPIKFSVKKSMEISLEDEETELKDDHDFVESNILLAKSDVIESVAFKSRLNRISHGVYLTLARYCGQLSSSLTLAKSNQTKSFPVKYEEFANFYDAVVYEYSCRGVIIENETKSIWEKIEKVSHPKNNPLISNFPNSMPWQCIHWWMFRPDGGLRPKTWGELIDMHAVIKQVYFGRNAYKRKSVDDSYIAAISKAMRPSSGKIVSVSFKSKISMGKNLDKNNYSKDNNNNYNHNDDNDDETEKEVSVHNAKSSISKYAVSVSNQIRSKSKQTRSINDSKLSLSQLRMYSAWDVVSEACNILRPQFERYCNFNDREKAMDYYKFQSFVRHIHAIYVFHVGPECSSRYRQYKKRWAEYTWYSIHLNHFHEHENLTLNFNAFWKWLQSQDLFLTMLNISGHFESTNESLNKQLHIYYCVLQAVNSASPSSLKEFKKANQKRCIVS